MGGERGIVNGLAARKPLSQSLNPGRTLSEGRGNEAPILSNGAVMTKHRWHQHSVIRTNV